MKNVSILVEEIFFNIKEELNAALKNNYEVRRDRYDKSGCDEFTAYCTAKIHCLSGIIDFVEELEDKYLSSLNNDLTSEEC